VVGVKAGLLLLVALVAQASFVAEVHFFGAHGEILWLVPVVAGLTAGPERGALAGFTAGIAVDLLVQTPFGLTALAMSLVGYGVGAFQSGVLRASWWMPVVAAVAGSSVGVVLYALAATVVGEQGVLDGRLARVVLAVVLWNVVLVVPALRLARWVEGVGGRPALGRV
jgi:rod shape-determining protein MreD